MSLKDDKFYIGFTSQHPDKRLEGHNKGNTNSTKKRRPFRLIYTRPILAKKMPEEEKNISKQIKVNQL